MIGAIRIAQRNALVYRRAWRGSLFMSFLQPTLFLLAIGVGLGSLVDAGSPLPGGVSFLEFLAPGLLAAACMQTATYESSYPISGKMTWRRNYEAMTATPIGTADLVFGELVWIAVRLSAVAVAFAAVMVAFGVARSRLALLAVPAAVLTGLAFSAPLMAYAATLKGNSNNFNLVFRFIITPLFLFSGVFFPLSRLPQGLQIAAWCTPLFHGVELTRGLTLGTIDSPSWVVHVGYLFMMLGAGIVAALRTFDQRLRA
jgi:lipooligosaccharide transport system permease protein